MNQKISFLSITYILSGNLISIISGVTDGVASTVLAIFGFIILFSGYNMLGREYDINIKKGASKLRIAAIIGLVGAAIDLIPILGTVSYVFYILSFVYQIFGMLDIRKSEILAEEGKTGVSLIFFAMALAILTGLLNFIPFVGGTAAQFVAYSSIMLMFYGWVKIQKSAC